MQDLIGQSLGRYHIIEQLGQGGMATVYKAFDTRLEREVAVKVIRREAFSPEIVDRMLQRFEREAKALSKLTHANIVPIIDYGDEGGSPYLVMPLINGGTLKELMSKQVFSPVDAARLLAPIAKALEYANSRGILHRDVKPSNILITDSGDPMLSDFGIAKILEEGESATLTGTGMGLGTPEYMAPEQWVGKSTSASDQYSLAVVFYEMITGHKPYTAETPIAVLLKQSNEPLPRPREFVAEIPDDVEHFLFKSLAKKPEDRYQTMGEFSSSFLRLANAEATVGTNVQKRPSEKQNFASNHDSLGTFDNLEPQSSLPSSQFSQSANRKAQRISNPKENGLLNGSTRKKQKIIVFSSVAIAIILLIFGIINGWFNTLFVSSTIPTAVDIQVRENPTLSIGSTKVSEVDGMTMVYVPAGDFRMGSPSGIGKEDEYPPHTVNLDAYWIDQTEVTNAMYAKCVSESKCTNPSKRSSYSRDTYFNDFIYDDYPVIYVDWNQAKTYCTWAGKRLPTEAEWEKAARGNLGSDYPWDGIYVESKFANYGNYLGDTSMAGFYAEGSSPYGALDMAGNVWEWVADWYGIYPTSATANPQGASSGTTKVVRGGSYLSDEYDIRSANRYSFFISDFYSFVGFRCAISE